MARESAPLILGQYFKRRRNIVEVVLIRKFILYISNIINIQLSEDFALQFFFSERYNLYRGIGRGLSLFYSGRILERTLT